MRRRQLLAGFSAVSLSGISGCQFLNPSTGGSARLCEVSVINRYPEQVESKIEISGTAGVQIEDEVQLEPAAQTNDTHYLEGDELPANAGQYSVNVTISGDEWTAEDEYDTAGEELDAVSIVWMVEGAAESENPPELQLLTSQKNANC